MISVVIPARNEEKFLADCLESLTNQDYGGEYEIIVADNGSTDKTVEIARNFGARVVACSEKKGVSHARQAGADAARGALIVQADADTIYPRDFLTRIVEQFTAHPEAAAVAGRFLYRDPPSWAKLEYFLRYHLSRLTLFLFGRPLLISGATLAFRRRAFLSVNGYKDITYSADQIGITGRLRKLGKILYDPNLQVLTSARSVKKPFFFIVLDVCVHLNRVAMHFAQFCLETGQQFATKTRARRIALHAMPAIMLFLLFVAYGYFVPASPVFGKVYSKGKATGQVVALTFDDGPNEPYTSKILDILAIHNVKATFFVIGKNVELYPQTAKRIAAEGHVVGNHSYSHNANHAITQYGCRDMLLAQATIFSIIGVRPRFYRPPHGKKSPWEIQAAKKLGLVEVTWTVSANELKAKSAIPLAQQIAAKADPGEIILLHDGYGTSHNCPEADKSRTVAALPLIIEQLQAKGFEFVTLPELLDIPPYNDDQAW